MSLRLHAVLKKLITSASRPSTSPTHERLEMKFRFGSGIGRSIVSSFSIVCMYMSVHLRLHVLKHCPHQIRCFGVAV